MLAAAAETAGSVYSDDGRTGYQRLEVRCRRAYGFDTLCAELAAPSPRRPVIEVSYELTPADGDPEGGGWIAALTHALGRPRTDRREDVPADASDRVRRYAAWNAGDASVGLSIYGAPRETAAGRSAGRLWLNWSENLAAQPFLGAWQAANASLEMAARRADAPVIFTLQAEQIACMGRPEGREARLALYQPGILRTPLSIAAKLSKQRFALWHSPADRIHCLSTYWDSVIWDEGQAVRVTRHEVAPAKGGGFSELAVSGWSVRDHHGSREIAAAAERLSRIAGVSVERVEGYDC